MDPQQLVDGLPDAIVVIAADGRAVAVNRAFTQAFGDLARRLAGEADALGALTAAKDPPLPPGGEAIEATGPNGRRWLAGSRAIGDGGRVLWWRPLSRRAKGADSNAALAAADARATEALRAKARTLALMSHELRQPVATIIDAVRPLLASPLGPSERAKVALILRSVDGLRQLGDELTNLANLEAGEIRLAEEPFNVETVVGSALAAVREKAAERGLRGEAIIHHEVPAKVVGDPVWLRHVLIEVLRLAVAEAPGRLVTVRVERRALAGGQEGLHFAVAPVAEALAEPLEVWLGETTPVAAVTSMREAGVRGLGLTLCRRIIALMGGAFGVGEGEEDARGGGRPSGGRVVWFTVAADLGPAAGVGAPLAMPSLSILAVEDNPIEQRLNAWALEKDGHRVTVVADGRQAARMVATGGFDVVLIDIDTSEFEAITATQGIRALCAPEGRVPIIAIGANPSPVSIERCLDGGVDAFLAKPLNPVTLSRTLAGFVDDPRPPSAREFDEGALTALIAVLGGDRVGVLIEGFLEQAAVLAPRLDAARLAEDEVALAATANTLTRLAGTLGLLAVHEAARALERGLGDGDRAATNGRAEHLSGALERAVDVLKARG